MKHTLLCLAGAACLVGGCTHNVNVQPIKVEPIYITMDIHIKVDRELENFFSFQDTIEKKLESESKEP